MATNQEIAAWLAANPNATTAEITSAANSAGVPLSQVAAVQAQIFDPFSSNINPTALSATQKLDINNLPSTYGKIYSGAGGDTGADPTASGYFSTNEIVNGVPVTAYYDAQGNVTKYVANTPARGLSDTERLSAEWNPTGKATPVQWSEDNGLFNSGFTMTDATMAAIAAMTAGGTLGASEAAAASSGGAEAGATSTAGANAGGSTMLDYSMPTSQGGLGLQGTAAVDGTLSSGLAAPAAGTGGVGLTASTAGNLASMGGAQGLLANAAGGGTLSAAGVNTGLFTAENLAKTIAGGGSAAASLVNTLKNLTPTQAAQLAKAGISVAGLLGTGAAVGGLANAAGGGSGGLFGTQQQDRSGVSSGSAQYSPEYYAALQAKYNQMMPQQPRDVTTDLKNWYETKYAPTAQKVTP